MNILYLPSHCVLEYLEVKMLSDLGHKVFSPGAYYKPDKPIGNLDREPLNLDIPQKWYEMYDAIGGKFPGVDAKEHLTTEFLREFDLLIFAWLPQHYISNIDAIKSAGTKVIWRTIGQSQFFTEQLMALHRDGFKIIRYSPKERDIPYYAGEDAVIRFYSPNEEIGGWTGESPMVLSSCQSLKARATECNYVTWETVTGGYNRFMLGPGNEDLPYSTKVSYCELLQFNRLARCYMNLGTMPASYTLGFMTALTTGCPVVSIGPKLGSGMHPIFEVQDLIENEVDGFVSDDIRLLKFYIQQLLEDWNLARKISMAGIKKAQQLFGENKIRGEWKEFLECL